MNTAKMCSIDGCEGSVFARGWCAPHWKEWRKSADPSEIKPVRQPTVFPGDRFGRLVVVEYSHTVKRKRCYLCRCSCGNEKTISASNLRTGKTTSCGCRSREVAAARLRTHDMTETPTYVSWMSMLHRCTRPTASQWKYYGGAGVMVCERWRLFENFLTDMGERPAGTSLGRFGDTGNYEPGNCAWQTVAEHRIEQRKKRAAG